MKPIEKLKREIQLWYKNTLTYDESAVLYIVLQMIDKFEKEDDNG